MSGAVEPHRPERIAGVKRAWAPVFLRDWHPVPRDPLDRALTRCTSRRLQHRFGRALVSDAV